MATALAYAGPQCPRCGATLILDYLQQGESICERCQGFFEATLFQPPAPLVPPVIETVVVAGPSGATACANHARNAAVTSCSRCGLFICSLCEMNTGSGSFCPSCFERKSTEGGITTRYRDWALIARLTAVFGMLLYIFWPILGGLAIFFAAKGIGQRRREGLTIIGMIVVMLLGLAELVAGIVMYGFMFWAMFRGVR